jgi:hypothetical protein
VWQFLKRFWPVWVCAFWVALVCAVYARLVVTGDYSRSEKLAAAEVATAVAGFGAGFVALYAVSKQLSPPRAELRLRVAADATGNALTIAVRNKGGSPSVRAALIFEGASPGTVEAKEGIPDWYTDNRPAAWHSLRRRKFEMEAHTDFEPVSPGPIKIPASVVAVRVECRNGDGDLWVHPRRQTGG